MIDDNRLQDRFLIALADLTRDLGHVDHLEPALCRILDAAMADGGVDCGGVYLVGEDGALDLKAVRGVPEGFALFVRHFPADSLEAEVVRSGERCVWSRASIAALRLPDTDQGAIRSLLALPILLAGQPVASFNLASRVRDSIPAHDLAYYAALAGLAGLLLSRFRAESARADAQQAMRALAAEHTLVFDNAVAGLAILRQRRFVSCNAYFEQIFGYARGELIGQSAEILHRDHANFVARGARILQTFSAGKVFEDDEQFRRKDGQFIWLHLSARAINPARPLEDDSVWIFVDITEAKRHEAERQEALALLQAAIEQSPSGILIADAPDVHIRMANTAALGIRAGDPASLVHIDVHEHALRWKTFHPDGSPYLPEELPLSRAVLKGEVTRGEELIIHDENGGEHWVSANASPVRRDGGITAGIVIFHDITARKEAEQRIEHLAHHDMLTGLANRYSLDDRLAQALFSARRSGERLAVIFIDLDRFKLINDTLGHRVGDQLLLAVAQCLKNCVRESDIVARPGGDEFVIVLTRMHDSADAAAVAAEILQNIARPHAVDGQILHTSGSIGISVFPEDGGDAVILMKNADAAMYHAKAQGRNNAQFFTDAMNRAASERLLLERDLHLALAAGQFELYYQPQVGVADGADYGVEALLRWCHPQRGLLSPLSFIAIAEECGLIEALGAWVLHEACRQWAEWRALGLVGVHVAVNISAHQLRSLSLVENARSNMQEFGMANGDLELEITESVAMENPEHAIRQLAALCALGVRIAIDDFGTGYSSLAYLKRLPIKIIKLDQTFVRDIETDSNDAAISAATLALAHSLGLQVVAEGVENAAQRAFLAAQGCDYLQGFLLGRPEPAAQLTQRWQRQGRLADPHNIDAID